MTRLRQAEVSEPATKDLRDDMIRDEIDRAFRRFGPALAEIEDLFADN